MVMCCVAQSTDVLLESMFFCRIVFRKRQSVKLTKVCKCGLVDLSE